MDRLVVCVHLFYCHTKEKKKQKEHNSASFIFYKLNQLPVRNQILNLFLDYIFTISKIVFQIIFQKSDNFDIK